MARSSGPLLSLGATGQIGKTMVYSSWKGIPYVRRHVTPANPKTAAQMLTRDALRWLHDMDKSAGPKLRAIFNEFAKGKPLTTHNIFIMWNLPTLRPATDTTGIVFSDSVNGGFPPQAATFTGGAGQVTVACPDPSLPPEWATVDLEAFAILRQDPHGETQGHVYEASDATSPYSAVVTVYSGAGTYDCGAVFKYTRPDGSVAYGRQIAGSAVVT